MNVLKDKQFYILWLGCIFGAMAVLPYIATLNSIVFTPGLIGLALVQSVILYGLVVFFGLKLSKKLDFKIVPTQKFVSLSIISGGVLGAILSLLDKYVFTNVNVLLKQAIHIEPWKGMLASFYGAINEEVLLRLFAVSLVVFILQKFSKNKWNFIISIIFCALLFGVGHLPMLYKIIGTPSTWDITRVIMLNGLGGLLFGVLYWRVGLVSAMLSHFVTDLVLHVFLNL